ncbi:MULTISPECIES: ABC transporter ATP-binding protein [Staphylococcus]|uniref:ABC transporter ATP-binding protein n=1 Tax=Staphylococcus TaxID=1279 RepID=UPI000E6913FD|nr:MULTISPECIES: ATP-binding cassette domain-containing protein [Staphylococcus]MBA1353722.1 ATP-binding cassette domain-containing protein [Staphylococcus cohnii]MBA1390095.1 ATP-binding cassette domain-containing protein [Staphylococcus cohnii]MCE5099180.1 ATP-binding cassette domain-containing protein [Staphylococcus cohnii]MSU29912.1 ATP-binding cassette domain-containing protein [Staphylococcus sp. McC-251-APC-3A2]RIL92275.1 ATP-binding cassette domain-containing protein [Staphylococcus c
MIKLQNINFAYKNAPILKNINLTIVSNEKVGIVGESGSGKTTLAHVMLGLLTNYQGQYSTQGLSMLPIFQHAYDSFNPKFKIQTALEEPIRYYKGSQSTADIRASLKYLMSYMHLEESLLQKFPDELSGGQLQRFNTIRTLMLAPDMLICDEITASLDVIAEQRMIKVLKDYHDQTNKGIIMISHDIAFLNQFVERIVVMKDGEIVDDFPIAYLFSEERHHYTKALLSIY